MAFAKKSATLKVTHFLRSVLSASKWLTAAYIFAPSSVYLLSPPNFRYLTMDPYQPNRYRTLDDFREALRGCIAQRARCAIVGNLVWMWQAV